MPKMWESRHPETMAKRKKPYLRDGSRMAADARRQALLNFMRARNLQIASWCDKAQTSKNSIYNFLNNRSDSLSTDTLEKLAAAAGATVSELMGESPVEVKGRSRPIPVKGEVQAGSWREAIEHNDFEAYPLIMPPIPDLGVDNYALIVRGNSMNKLYPDGTPIICAPVYSFRRPLQPGDKVHIERRNRRGEIEATIKEIDKDPEGVLWLYPRSTDSRYQSPLPLPTGNGDVPTEDGIEHIEIKGVVVYAVVKQA